MALSLDGTTGITSDGGTPVIENLDTTATGIAVTGELTTTGKVGIGTTSPSAKLHTVGSAGVYSLLTQAASTSGTYYHQLFKNDSTEIAYASSNGGEFAINTVGATPFVLGTNAAERVRIDADGLKFHGDTAAANALDDYEEGTWTPTAVTNGSGTPVTWYNNGSTYTKIGRLVYVKFRVQVAPSSGTEIRIYGIPFGSVDGDSAHGTSLATRTSTNHTVVINTDHIRLEGTNNYSYLYGMVIYNTNT